MSLPYIFLTTLFLVLIEFLIANLLIDLVWLVRSRILTSLLDMLRIHPISLSINPNFTKSFLLNPGFYYPAPTSGFSSISIFLITFF